MAQRDHEPFALASDREREPDPVTLTALHRSVVAMTVQMHTLTGNVAENTAMTRVTRREVGELRTFVLDDLAPRLTGTERTAAAAKETAEVAVTEQRSIARKVVAGTGKGAAATLALSAAGIAATVLAKHWPWLQSVADALSGVSSP